jgi:hypothetical protein
MFLEFIIKILKFFEFKLERYNLILKRKNRNDKPLFINIGGGRFFKENWRVLDYNKKSKIDLFIDYKVDLMKIIKWGIKDNSFKLAYCSHVIEHLSDDAVKNLFSNTFRILKKGSIFRIVVPDIDLALYHYKMKNLDWFLTFYNTPSYRPKNMVFALEYYLITFFATMKRERINLREVRSYFKNTTKKEFLKKYKADYSYDHPNYHINWFNFKKLKSFLKMAGFIKIKKSEFKKSKEIEFCHKEFDKTSPQMSLFVECKK